MIKNVSITFFLVFLIVILKLSIRDDSVSEKDHVILVQSKTSTTLDKESLKNMPTPIKAPVEFLHGSNVSLENSADDFEVGNEAHFSSKGPEEINRANEKTLGFKDKFLKGLNLNSHQEKEIQFLWNFRKDRIKEQWNVIKEKSHLTPDAQIELWDMEIDAINNSMNLSVKNIIGNDELYERYLTRFNEYVGH